MKRLLLCEELLNRLKLFNLKRRQQRGYQGLEIMSGVEKVTRA